MRIRSFRRILIGLVLSVVLIAPAQLVSAGWVYWTYSNPPGGNEFNNTTWTHYTAVRSLTYSPWGIWFRKDDGPAMDIRWRGINCGSTPQFGWGAIQAISNADPAPPGGVFLKSNGSWPTQFMQFCLSAIHKGGSYIDHWIGRMNWDG